MASLSPVASADAFVAALEKSGLLDAAQLAKIRAAAATATDPKALARDLIKAGTLTRWQAGQLIHGYYLLVVGKYKLLDQLGSGEMGRVYLAEHVQMERRHALKILSRRHTAKPAVLTRFLAEAQRVCALDHRNLSHIYDINQDGDKYYLVMEFVEGQDLQKTVEAKGPLPAAQAVEYALQAAEGLAHAHEKQVFHGDLKPSNLVVDASGVVKITDIGQARLVEAPAAATDMEETSEAASLAAAVYRAPELRDGAQEVNARNDLYSLGNTLCFLLTGKAALDAADAQARLAQAQETPVELAALCRQMLAENPSERPRSMAEVHAALAAALASPARASLSESEEKATAPKARKPLTAKRIEEAAEAPLVAAVDGNAAAQLDNPLGGFVLKTKGRGGPAKSAPKKAGAGDLAPAAMRAEKKSYLPWIIGGAIGGGVLVLGGIVLAVVVVLNWGADQAEKLVADAKGAASKTATKAAAASVQAQSNPEANPESNPEATLAEPAAALKPAEPMPVPEPVKPAEPMPAVVQPLAAEPPEPAKPAEPMPEPVKPEPVEPVKPAEPLPAEPLPAEPPPAPPKAANPFQGFASSVSLPKLPVGTAEPSPETLAPLVLGPCAVDEKVLVILQLNGGGSAIRGGKQKFELKESEGGISLRDWEIVLTSGAKPLVVARLSAQNDQLTFAWSPEGAREPAAPLLCNCGLTMTAGSGRHDLALRQPVVAAPLTVELEKSGGAKWQIDLLPDPKSVFVEVAKLEGGFLKHKFDKPQMELSDTNAIWTGNDEDSLILGLKLTTTASARGIELKTAPQVKFEIGARPQVLIKKTLSIAEKQVKQEQAILTTRLQTLPAQQNERVEQQKNLLNAELEKVNERSGQLTQLAELIASLQGKGLVHFRVYHQTEDGQIDLLVTDSPPAVENKDEPPKEENEKK